MNKMNFPSGRSVDRCKQDAKKLVKISKEKGNKIKLAEALNVIAKENGIDLPWSKAIEKLKLEQC